MSSSQVAVVGAGPYGLASAAALRGSGIDTHVLGEEMSYWKQMPRGMFLRSPRHASSIADPHGPLGLDAYEADGGTRLPSPLPLDGFVRYGEWVQRQVVPDLDRRRVVQIEKARSGFRLRIADGDELRATRVVVATGLTAYARRPAEFSKLPAGAVSHTDDLTDPGVFAGKRVLVVGGGQSAIESAALVHEAGAQVEVVMRRPRLRWLVRSGRMHRSRFRPLLYPDPDVGPIGLNQIASRPAAFRRLPVSVGDPLAVRCIRPAAADWLVERMADVPIVTGRQLASVSPNGAGLQVRLDDSSERTVDHILLGTGYQLDVRRHPLLAPSLAEELRTREGYPRLRPGLESSVPGLHFVGALSAASFGPGMRFVSGTWFTAPALARRIGREAGSRRREATRPIATAEGAAADASPPGS
jgi:NADPH-dependent 2,4-dienoyl-CoA reductase/sulfur reductase-like enzyme